ncbi:aldo/keto reductase [Curtobacterium sp. RRHDQ10]|uniref:aldo/keto reductase n=1 Tax=Curtobacterium phyllosphaerae TaxID=3413379 RepID=UPI003BF1114F
MAPTDRAAVDETAGRRLRTGRVIPPIGLGTFGSDRYGPEQVAEAVRGGIDVGYRLIDCASVYGNEPAVGAAIAAAGVPRDDLFVMSKVWNDAHDPDAAVASVHRSIADLGVGRLDAVFVHWPFPNHHPPHASVDDRDAAARPYDHAAYLALWRALEDLVDAGLVDHLGTSNTTVPKLRLLLDDARVLPALNEMELHPTFQQPELFDLCRSADIQPVGYSPLGSPSRPDRDRADDDPVDVEHPTVQRIARDHRVHPAVVCLKWAVARGQVPIPFSVKPEQYRANLEGALTDPLTAEELAAMADVDRGARLIKGQVFLWRGADSWRDLWDEDGTIAGGAGDPVA